MARGKRTELKVGAIILVSLVILFASLYWLQGYQMERNAQEYQVLFSDVGTLSPGDRVLVLGVNMGKVDALRLTADGVLVDLLLYRDVELRADAKFVIKNLGVMGERFIAVNPGSTEQPLDANGIIIGEAEVGLPELMGTVGQIVTEIRNMVRVLRQTVASDTTLARFNNMVANMERLSQSLSTFMTVNDQRLNQTVTNFQQASGELSAMLSRNAEAVDSAVTRFNHAGTELSGLVRSLDTLSASARNFAEQLNNGDGTLQLLMQDRRLYDDLRSTADNIDDLIADIKANPRKYINLKVELF